MDTHTSTEAGERHVEPGERTADRCVLVIFGASGDLTRRLLVPALYNLACAGLLPARMAVIGIARDDLSSDTFRARLSDDIRQFSTRADFDDDIWSRLIERFHYITGEFDDLSAYHRLKEKVSELDAAIGCEGNQLFYMAVPPSLFGMISTHMAESGLGAVGAGWKRIVIEKPFGRDHASAVELNRELLQHWREDQIFRIDHYLGKETVQNILAFRFSNGMFEPLWNKSHVDHVQITVAESVGVGARGNYYERAGALRDMIQNHVFQMLAYVCMEPPASFHADAIRGEKTKLLNAVRIMTAEQVPTHTVRGQYGSGRLSDDTPAPGYREERDVAADSWTETFAAIKVHVDNWRWEGVPFYLRSGKRLWKRGTEIVVQFKKAPEVLFRDTQVDRLDANQLIFHVQPDQGIEVRFQAKTPGPSLRLQPVNMRFSYGEHFKTPRGTGYEVLLHDCLVGDATLFSHTDLVETAWRVVQPILDHWAESAPARFPNYPAGSWGPRAAFDLIEADGRRWVEVIHRDTLQSIPLFGECDPVFLNALVMTLKPVAVDGGEVLMHRGEPGHEMYIICRGVVDVLGEDEQPIHTLAEGSFFGEIALLMNRSRTATVRTRTPCDLFVLERNDFHQVLKAHPQFARSILAIARERYEVAATAEQVFDFDVLQHLS